MLALGSKNELCDAYVSIKVACGTGMRRGWGEVLGGCAIVGAEARMGAGLHMQQRCGSAHDIKHGACMGHCGTSYEL